MERRNMTMTATKQQKTDHYFLSQWFPRQWLWRSSTSVSWRGKLLIRFGWNSCLHLQGFTFTRNVSYLTVLFQLAPECNCLQGIISISYSLSSGSNLDPLLSGFSWRRLFVFFPRSFQANEEAIKLGRIFPIHNSLNIAQIPLHMIRIVENIIT
jgi:hypothetical protein